MVSPSLPYIVTFPSLNTAHFTPLARSTSAMNFSGMGGAGGGPAGTGGATGRVISGVDATGRGGGATTFG